MTLEFVHWPGRQTEMTKEDFEALGKRKRLFKIIDEKDSPKIKQQIISNLIGTGAKQEKASSGQPKNTQPAPGKRQRRIES
jgi:hypothetical protein